jgi:hypothetical protein
MDGDRAPDPVASPPLPYPAAPNVSAPRLMPIQRPAEADPATVDTRRRLAVLIGAVAVLALVAGLVWWATDDGSAGGGSVGMGDAPAGVGGIGSAPTGEPTPGPQGGAPGAAGGPGVGPGGSAAPGGPPPTGGQPTAPAQTGARLLATYVIVRGLLSDQMTITITNSGDRDGKWSSVTVTFDGVNLVIVPGEGVSYELRGGVHTFTPHASLQTVPPGSSVSFDFTTTVGGVLGDPTGCSLDGQECKG